MIELTQVTKRYRTGQVETTALDRIDLQIEAGEYVAITGPSGCGKSTLLGLLGLLDVPTSGSYRLQGEEVAARSSRELAAIRRGRISFVFQSFNLVDEMTVHDNVQLALRYGELSGKAQRQRVAEVLERLGLSHRADHHPSQLSGGQQQRVAIARAIASRPALLLADEPTGNLDSAHGQEVMRLLRELNDEGTTLVMVTHSAEHAALASRGVRLLDGRVLVDTYADQL
ncbi:ABC transporter ATP-binding protein [Steroidobacter agaridevorans]|uniref:ABC transporter ATP-binding protein n=1 Tax=Steroidobacter agaridevorans TaxID=2695856 RepID=A0A829YPZ3_9GAMM|nr:ABC transporter ATP-binding protein [Steroidobacter agaridevorans]GFE84842.1 ABC transporter ATP-binding protein [Steroidobacter agaridevorans]GFE91823.1 ABC transporter ATP-binding protein [Steroidobacter agaridevorans]